MALADLLTETMDVKAKTNTVAANAGFGRSESTKASAVPCRVMDSASGQTYIAGSRGAINDHPIVTEYAGVDNGDTVVITTLQGSVTCRVVATNWRRAIGGMDDFYVLTVLEIEN